MSDKPRKKYPFSQLLDVARKSGRLLLDRNTSWKVRLMLLAALVYLIFPYDVLPDWLLGLGIVDDLAIVSLLVWLALKMSENEEGA